MLLQRQSPNLRPLTTAHLAQTMTLLGLTAAELSQKIEAELSKNPALELIEDRRCPTCKRKLIDNANCPFCSRPKGLANDQPIVFVSPREDFHPPVGNYSEEMPDDNLAAAEEDLPQFVLRQVAPELMPEDRPIAAAILTNLNEDGLLATPLVEIAHYHHVSLSRVISVLRIIQHAEPVGVASPTTQEALLVQLEVLSENHRVPPGTEDVIVHGMSLLSRHRYADLAHLLNIPVSRIKEIARFISENLNPFPARAHWGEINLGSQGHNRGTGAYQFPDIIISLLNNQDDTALVIEIAMPIAGTLRVNPLFREAVRQAPSDKEEEWKADLEQATLLVKCLQQRNHTIVRLMEQLAVLQREFILHGEAFLLPITRASLAKALDVHESTISRAVSAKAVQLPNGHIVPLAMFFDRSLHIRTALKKIIEQEHQPLSDTELGELLAGMGYPVARRTVAKYRAMEGILPAHLRKPNRYAPQAPEILSVG